MATVRLTAPRDYVLSAPDGDHILRKIHEKDHAYELPAMVALAALVPKAGVIADVGANVGNHTLFWALHGFTVHAYEPNSDTLDWLRRNVEDNNLGGLITVHPVALGSDPGQGFLEVPENHLGAGTLHVSDRGPIRIERLDDQTLDRLDAIKIDVEGHELEVLKGARGTLRKHHPVLMVEAWSAASTQLIDQELIPIGYRRLPAPIAGAPAHLYVPSDSFRHAMTTPAVLLAMAKIKAGRTKGAAVRHLRGLRNRSGR